MLGENYCSVHEIVTTTLLSRLASQAQQKYGASFLGFAATTGGGPLETKF
jgi:hypothetical protein